MSYSEAIGKGSESVVPLGQARSYELGIPSMLKSVDLPDLKRAQPPVPGAPTVDPNAVRPGDINAGRTLLSIENQEAGGASLSRPPSMGKPFSFPAVIVGLAIVFYLAKRDSGGGGGLKKARRELGESREAKAEAKAEAKEAKAEAKQVERDYKAELRAAAAEQKALQRAAQAKKDAAKLEKTLAASAALRAAADEAKRS